MSLSTLTLALERRLYTTLRARADARHPTAPHLLTGIRGEDAAFFHLRSLGYTIVARRWRTRRLPGDLDLVAWHTHPQLGPTLVFFEIKTRIAASRAEAFAPAETDVDAYKQDTLRRMAAAYLRCLPEPNRASIPLRFDILSVYVPPSGAPPVFDHLPNAFPSTAPPRRPRR